MYTYRLKLFVENDNRKCGQHNQVGKAQPALVLFFCERFVDAPAAAAAILVFVVFLSCVSLLALFFSLILTHKKHTVLLSMLDGPIALEYMLLLPTYIKHKSTLIQRKIDYEM